MNNTTDTKRAGSLAIQFFKWVENNIYFPNTYFPFKKSWIPVNSKEYETPDPETGRSF